MNILHISPYAELGGCEFNALTIIEEIDAQHDVLLLNDGNGPFVRKWQNAKASVENCELLTQPFYRWKKKLQEHLVGRQFDVIIYWSHMHMPVVLSAITQLASRILVHIGNPVVFGIKQKWMRSFQNALYSYDKSTVELRPVSNYVLQTSIITPSYRKLRSKVSFKPIVVESFERVNNASVQGKIIGMMARMDAIKDFTTLILAFALLNKLQPDAKLYLAGDGPDRLRLEALCLQLGISNSVLFLGRVDDKKYFYQSIDVFVYATSSKEGLAGVVGEALVSGVPTICSDLPMLREWDPENAAIQWFEAQNPDQLKERLLLTLGDYEHFMNNAREHSPSFRSRFAPSTFAKNYIDA